MRKTSLVLAALLAMAGVCVMLWPTFTGSRLESYAEEAAQTFLEERKPEQKHSELLADLQAYNQRIYAEKQSSLVDLEACEESAADLIAYGIEDEIIGVLEIPAMELTMPVYLGASDAHLAAGAAVLGNTSAPIGGDNTNCVIAGHRGWRGADYFRHIDRLQVGDTVTLTNLWETLTYTVSKSALLKARCRLFISSRLPHTLWREELPMTEVDRDIALVLLKRLRKRELISEETYVSACNSRFFDKCRFTSDTEAMEEIMVEEADTHDDSSMVERADAAGQVNL